MTQKHNWQTIKFIIWGIITVFFNIVLYHLLYLKMGLNYQVANIITWFITVLFSYVINKVFVFDSKTKISITEVFLFFSSRVLSLVVELFVLWLIYDLLSVEITVSKIVSHGIALVINYFLSKTLFLEKKPT
ncbi:GtrA family protein [Enterococcus sp. LJL99]